MAESRSSHQDSHVRRLLLSLPGLVLSRLAILAAILLAWEYGTSAKVQFWISRPSAIGRTVYDWFLDGSIWPHLMATLTAMASGYVLGCAIGIGAGLGLGFAPRLARLLGPYISAFYALPKVALAPLFIILLGIGLESKIALVTLTVFFIVMNATLDGVRDIDSDIVQSLRLMGATRGEITRKVVMPATLPWIFTGMRISVRYAFTGTLLAELIGANQGLGYLIQRASASFDTADAYAAIFVMVVFSVGMTEILTRIERVLAHRIR